MGVRCVLVLAVLLVVGEAAGAAEIVLWPEAVPGPRVPAEPAEKVEKSAKDGIQRRSHVSNPRLVVYDIPRVDPAVRRSAVIIAPGGGFGILADEHEGSDLCQWFNERGIVAFLCLYRVPVKDNTGPVLDIQKAVHDVRLRAGEYGIDPAKIALVGFSAGGQASLVAATSKPGFTVADNGSTRPDALLLVYPWKVAGPDNKGLRSDVVIDGTAPPIFVSQAANDPASVPQGAMNLMAACLEAKVPVELHIYEAGGHGFGMRPRDKAPGTSDWPNRAIDWLKARGW